MFLCPSPHSPRAGSPQAGTSCQVPFPKGLVVGRSQPGRGWGGGYRPEGGMLGWKHCRGPGSWCLLCSGEQCERDSKHQNASSTNKSCSRLNLGRGGGGAERVGIMSVWRAQGNIELSLLKYAIVIHLQGLPSHHVKQ